MGYAEDMERLSAAAQAEAREGLIQHCIKGMDETEIAQFRTLFDQLDTASTALRDGVMQSLVHFAVQDRMVDMLINGTGKGNPLGLLGN